VGKQSSQLPTVTTLPYDSLKCWFYPHWNKTEWWKLRMIS